MKTIVEMIEQLKQENNYKFEGDTRILELGKLVEIEHAHNFPNLDPNITATMVALDHIKQNTNYYIKLIQANLVDEKPAIEYYNNNFRFDNSTEVSAEEV